MEKLATILYFDVIREMCLQIGTYPWWTYVVILHSSVWKQQTFTLLVHAQQVKGQVSKYI